ncbi:MAG: hypothetical protein IPI49_18125 [Myxococcales bacterium]|nr:hypothetical protein [Myxococcales bacterium]
MAPPPAGTLEEARRDFEAQLLLLVQTAPECSLAQLGAARALALELELHLALAAKDWTLGLVCAMERCLELMALGQVDLGVALPALAMAAASLDQGVAPQNAAWFEVETLLPVPAQPARSKVPAGAARCAGHRAGARSRATAEPAIDPFLAASVGWPEVVRETVARARRATVARTAGPSLG